MVAADDIRRIVGAPRGDPRPCCVVSGRGGVRAAWRGEVAASRCR